MSDLRRWSEEGAPDAVVDALLIAREERPSRALHGRVLGAVGVVPAVLTAASSSTAAVSAGGTSVLVKIAGLSAFVVTAAMGAWTLTETSAPAPPAVTTVVAAKPAPPPPEPPAPAETSPAASADVEEPEPSPSAAPVERPRHAAQAGASVQLSQEVEALKRARKALSSESPEVAMQELEKYNKRFPNGTLAAEETVLRVQALLKRGQKARAVALADRFAAAHPESPYARRVLDVVRGAR